jgi:hypothetical protein
MTVMACECEEEEEREREQGREEKESGSEYFKGIGEHCKPPFLFGRAWMCARCHTLAPRVFTLMTFDRFKSPLR